MEIIQMHYLRPLKQTVRRAFTLLETLMVVAVVSTVAAGVVLAISNVTQVARATKLQRDVVVVNNAIRTYMLNGGTFLTSDLANPATVLAKLKKRATTDSAKQLAGLRNTMADERLTFQIQSADDAYGPTERARFVGDPANPRFEIQHGGPPGISAFILDSALAGQDFGSEERAGTLKLAKSDPWVWDYLESNPSRREPDVRPLGDATVTVTGVSEESIALALNPPRFSIPGGATELDTFPKSLALLSVNPANSSEIVYSINGGPFIHYGGPFPLDPGTSVSAVSATLDPDKYSESSAAGQTYTAKPLTPLPAVQFSKAAYTYFELGGQAAPGSPPLPAGSVSGVGLLENLDRIPAPYQDSSVFRFVWTQDGSDPLNSGTALSQSDFSDGFIPAALPLPLAAFGKNEAAIIRTAVKAEDTSFVTNSAIITSTLHAASIDLRPPLATLDGRQVTLVLDVSSGGMPANARIYYTTDGTDPSVDALGNPVNGALYEGFPVELPGETGTSLTLNARAYAPVDYPQFFEASEPASVTLILPPPTEVYIGGSFASSAGNSLRNLAKLNNSGQVDRYFDTGEGASVGSIVGIVRQTTGGVVAGGDFERMDGQNRRGVVRLKSNGKVDYGFNAGLSAN